MSDLKKYIASRKRRDAEFVKNYDKGYAEFKVGVLIREAREQAGLTQEEVAKKLHTKKTAISRLEQHATDVRLSTLLKLAKVLGKDLEVALR
jgi:HTH-type transcriptional regulator / antitoxin HipB